LKWDTYTAWSHNPTFCFCLLKKSKLENSCIYSRG
jgi:hypothetical protein